MKKQLCIIILFFIGWLFGATTTVSHAEWEQTIVNVPGYTNNVADTHMYFDEFIFIPLSDMETCPDGSTTNYLIRYEPTTGATTGYALPWGGLETAQVYEVVPGGDSDTLYVGAPYGTGTICIYSKSAGTATCHQPGGLFAGLNGAKMVVTTISDVDYVWTTGLNAAGNIGRFKADDQTFTDFDFSDNATMFYGITAVPTGVGEISMIYAASIGGQLLMFPSDLASPSDNNTTMVDFEVEEEIADLKLVALLYDGTYVWISVTDATEAGDRHGIIRYTPGITEGVLGTYTVYWSTAERGSTQCAALLDFNNRIWMPLEHYAGGVDCDDYTPGSRTLTSVTILDKTNFTMEVLMLTELTALDRSAAGITHDNHAVWIGGYGHTLKGKVLNLLKIRLVKDRGNVPFKGLVGRGMVIIN